MIAVSQVAERRDAGAPSTEARAGTAQGIILMLMATLSVMGILLIAPILPKLRDHYAAVPNIAILAPVLMTVPALCVALFSPLAGFLSDRMGRRKLLFAALALYAPLGVAPLFIENIWAVLATRVGVGITEAVVMTVSTAIIGDYFEGREREKWLAWQVACSSISAVVLLLGAGLLGSLNWKAPFAAYALSLVLLAVAVPLIWEPARRTATVTRVADIAFPTRTMVGICAITFLASVIFYIVPVQMGFILGEQGITDPAVVGATAALGAVAVPLGSLAYHPLSSLRVSLLLAGGFALAGIGLLVISATHTAVPTVGGVIVNQLGCGVLLPALLAWAMLLLPPALRGRGVGVWMGSFFVGQFIGPLLVHAAQVALDGLLPALALFGAIGVVAAVVATAVASRSRSAPRQGAHQGERA